MALTFQPSAVFEFTQSTAADTWVIVHNLNCYPTVDVYIDYNSEVQKVVPRSVVYTDANTCTVSFAAAQTGKATVS